MIEGPFTPNRVVGPGTASVQTDLEFQPLSVQPLKTGQAVAAEQRRVGQNDQLNLEAMTLTIKDAETSDQLTFKVDQGALAGIKEADRVLIDYQENEGVLVAVQIRSAS